MRIENARLRRRIVDLVQEIAPEGHFDLKLVDLRGYEQAARKEQISTQKTHEMGERFNLRAGPLIRGRLIKVAAGEHVLLITTHHIVSDGWSIGVFVDELA